jgi:hypothetical protein
MKKKGLLKFKQINQTWLYFPCGSNLIYNTRSLCAESDEPAVLSSGGIIFSLLPFCFTSFFICFFIKKEKE